MDFVGADGIRPTMTTLVSARDEVRDTIGRFDTNSVWERGSAPPGPGMWSLIPFSPVIAWETGGDRVYLTHGQEHQIEVYDRSGDLVALWREAGVRYRVTADEQALYEAEREAAERPAPDDVPYPEWFPAYDRLRLAHDGSLWVRWAPRPSDLHRRWSVYSADGSSVRRVVLPDVDVRAVRNGRIYALVEDDLGIQKVVVLPASE